METGRNVMHYALGDNQDYEHEWSRAVLEYLENGYSSEERRAGETLLHFGMAWESSPVQRFS